MRAQGRHFLRTVRQLGVDVGKSLLSFGQLYHRVDLSHEGRKLMQCSQPVLFVLI